LLHNPRQETRRGKRQPRLCTTYPRERHYEYSSANLAQHYEYSNIRTFETSNIRTLRRLPAKGALTEQTSTMPLSLFTTNRARASALHSSAMISSGSLVLAC
jgi:hypothetical protein